CRQPAAERETRWRYCKGCPLMAGCPYGETLEADVPADDDGFAGWGDAARPVVLAPAFPTPVEGRVGLEVPLRLLFVGPRAAGHAEDLWAAVREAGADAKGGLGPDRVTFDVLSRGPAGEPVVRRREVDVPLRPDGVAGVVPEVRVTLTAPLFLR